ncbi:DUF4136 domain-containing protein [Shewanella insulae]|uniref:DUF4136 domain-containing protein n=1 Tax=Shewanella insulae TaxID=2681496 RepID=A0A6L7I1X7_9GAMM|nr:DUF4136 domain-containing protein [Shewanella insulae]MCG9711513.1 DUF4136 domain-containing protein [Shewanella insulae]MCG9756780.1 DUF4136 domain-containing protein [Shewanella insulae]MXR70576.1 DUF4136 domain-containing protein [Shewanella insulae]
MNLLRLLILTIATLLLSACASKPSTDYDTQYDFGSLKHFTLQRPTDIGDPLSTERIDNAIVENLTQRGYQQSPDQTQFMVTYGFKVVDKPKRSGVSIGLGTGSWGSSGGVGVSTSVGVPLGKDNTKMQIIQIDIVDSASNKLIWRGSDKFDYDDGGEKKAKETRETISKILNQFPPKTE